MSDEQPRAYTSEEVAEMIIDHSRAMARYWANLPEFDKATGYSKTIQDRCDGVAFSILTMLDGCTGSLPAMTLKPDPHPEDKEYCIENDENWFDPDTEVSTMLHEMYHKKDNAK